MFEQLDRSDRWFAQAHIARADSARAIENVEFISAPSMARDFLSAVTLY
jgi:hypothetical protein